MKADIQKASVVAILSWGMLVALPAIARSDPSPGQVAAVLEAGNDLYAEQLADAALTGQALAPADRAHLLMSRGLAREHLGRPEEALADFSAALGTGALSPSEMIRARFDRGVVLDELGRTKEAIADYDAAIARAPDFAAALNNRANAWRRLGRLDFAARDYTASLDSGNPQPEFPLFGLGQVAEATGRKDAARAFYRQALASNPHYDAANQSLARLKAPPRVPKPGRARIAATYPGSASAAAPPAGSAHVIQLGAFRDRLSALRAWARISKVTGRLLDGLQPKIMTVDLPGRGRFYRLRAGPVVSDACRRVISTGYGCFAVHNPRIRAASAKR